MKIADDVIVRRWEIEETKRIGRRGEVDRTSIEVVAAEMRVPYERVRDLVMERLTGGFSG